MLLPDPFPVDGVGRSVTRCAFDAALIGRREYATAPVPLRFPCSTCATWHELKSFASTPKSNRPIICDECRKQIARENDES